MQLLRWTLLGCLIVGLAGCARSNSSEPTALRSSSKPDQTPQTTNKEKIVGTWEATKSDPVSPGGTLEFTKDGKMKLSTKLNAQTVIDSPGTYEVEGDKLTTALKGLDNKEEKRTDIIEKLTDTQLIIKYTEGKSVEFKKKK
ncbi:MAG TPA: lipocalin family protein [Gemmataceae bacterium]|nr:lipocalin family protein [Gemmataceae bacterium]